MASSSPRSDSPDMGDCDSEITSTLSFSVGYFPCEDNISIEETVLLEDSTSNVCSSVNLIPPIQGTWGTESINRRISQRNLIQDNPQQICKLGIIVAWADNDDFEESTAHENLSGGEGLLNRCPKDQTRLTEDKLDGLVKLLKTFQDVHRDDEENKKDNNESKKYGKENKKKNRRNNEDNAFDYLELTPVEDLKLCRSSTPRMSRVSHQDHDMGQDLPRRKSPANKGIIQVPEIPRMRKEEELAEMEGRKKKQKKNKYKNKSNWTRKQERDGRRREVRRKREGR
ncbi:PREDICTED: uncharacterized protein C12orf71 homolog isoform X2 [Chinchilla lanigera]|uniref:uncharacterized protein C12orf71 homolog isoform X2 n=1 Tax=Chinchilla lanigera TaxID=34839 RepID=UPI0006964ECA|nr:PREDICTED: uncharacterized protein C12orf71 homolog isoform X2 [Chinchilla lanigera]